MHYAIFQRCGTADRIKVKTFAEGVAEIELQLAQQRVKTHQAQQLPSAITVDAINLALAYLDLQCTAEGIHLWLPPGLPMPVQIKIHIIWPAFQRRRNVRGGGSFVELAAQ